MRSIYSVLLLFLLSCNHSVLVLNAPPEISKEMWYQIKTEDDFSPSVFDAHDWLDAPAGKHGFVVQKDDHFEFENGIPIKF